MADIFLSYNENDRDTVRRLAGTLEAAGWSVWWDRRIPAGGTWRNLLERELAAMRCMVVVWSSHSVKSEWVCEEATEGRQLGCLVPVCIERVKPPAGFREIQAADLVGWDGSATSPGMRTLIDDIRQRIGAPRAQAIVTPTIVPDAPDSPVSIKRRRAWVLAGGPVATLIAIGLFMGPLRPDLSQATDAAKEVLPPATVIAPPGSPKAEVPGADPSTRPVSLPRPTPDAAVPIASAHVVRPQTTKPATSTSGKRTQCAGLVSRASLEDLTNDEKSFFQRNCNQ